MRRFLAWTGLTLSVLAGTALGASGVALGTAAGRDIVVGAGIRMANRSIDGTIAVGWVTGSVRRGLEVHDVVITAADSTPFAQISTVGVRYRLRDLLSGRIVLGQVTLGKPVVSLTQYPGGRFNFQKIFRLGGPSRGGVSPLVAFHDVEIDSGNVVVRTVANAGDTARGEYTPEMENGYQVQRFQNVFARLSYLRLASPLPGEQAILADIDDLRVRVTDPALVIRGLTGRAELAGSTVKVGLSRVDAGSSHAKVNGTISWPRDTLMFDLVAETRDAVVDDLRPLVPVLPKGLEASGTFTVRSLAGDILAVGARGLEITGRRGGGNITGQATLVVGPRKTWSFKETSVRLDSLDLEYARGLFDTLPIAGRLTGTVAADGPHDHLAVEADLAFRDSLVHGWPVSRIHGNGVLAVGGAGGVVFQDFAVQNSKIDLSTVRRLLPAIALQGFLTADGTLTGPWLEMGFDGTLRHADAPFPETFARGLVQLDARGDTVGVWADLAFDSLHLPGLWTSYPGFKVLGSFAGRVRLEGYLDSLQLGLDLSGAAGRLKGGGALVLLGPHYAGRDLDFRFQALDIRSLDREPVLTSLNGRLRGGIAVDSARPPTGKILVELDSSRVGGSLVDSTRATVRTAGDILFVDSLSAWASGAHLAMRGGLGIRGEHRDSLVISAQLDSLHTLEPLLGGLLELPDDTARRPLAGVITANGSVTGAIDDFRLAMRVMSPSLRWGRFEAGKADLRGAWSSHASGEAQLAVTVESVRYGAIHFSVLAAEANGRTDSLAWMVHARDGDKANMLVAGRLEVDSTIVHVPLDSARLVLPTMAWTLARPTTVTVWDSSWVDVGDLGLVGADGISKLQFAGTIPMAGTGHLIVTLEALAVKDLFAVLQRETDGVGGQIAGTIDLAGMSRAPKLHATLSASDVLFGDFRIPRIEGTADYENHRLQGTFALRKQDARVMNVTADLPIDLALRTDADDRRLPGPVSVRAVADSMDLAILEAIWSTVRQASGRLDGDFGVVGTWKHPQLSGNLRVRNGAVTYPSLGVRHEGIEAQFAMHGDTVAVEQLSLRSGGGTLNVTGNLFLPELNRPAFGLHLAARDFFAIDSRNFVTLTTTGEFDLKGPATGATLTGHGTIPRGTLHFSDLLYKRVVNLEDTLFRGLIDTTLIRREGLGRAISNRFIDSLMVDSLRVDMGSDVTLRSTEANIQLTGSVIFSKAGGAYRADGTLNTPRGSYQLPLGSQYTTVPFDVTRGEVRMLGTPDLNGLVDIDAQHVVRRRTGDNINVFVHIGGTLYFPSITLSSDVRPALPETQIMSYLLFGAPTNPGTAASPSMQGLAQSALSAISGQIENTLLQNLGVPFKPDYFQISPGEVSQTGFAAGTQVEAGWANPFGIPVFITPSSRFGCGKFSENYGVSVEFRLSKEWRVAGSVEPVRGCNNTTGQAPGTANRQAGVDVLWEKNY